MIESGEVDHDNDRSQYRERTGERGNEEGEVKDRLERHGFGVGVP